MTPNLLLQSHVSLQSFTTFGIAATARHYCRVSDVLQLQQLIDCEEVAGLPRLILGGGSNVVLTRDFPGVVLHMALTGRDRIVDDQQYVYVRGAAGESWHEFVQWTLQQGWGGLENLSLIPGSVGAAPIQNIGAYGVEVKDYFHSLTFFEFATGTTRSLNSEECQFLYRDSIFKHRLRDQGIILDVTFRLPKNWQPKLGYGDVAQSLSGISSPTPQQVSLAICQLRQRKLPDPALIGNVGSFFKNPLVSAEICHTLQCQYPQLVSYLQSDGQYKLAAGWLIEQSGWKGKSSGRVGVYDKQALVLVNLGGATGPEVMALAAAVQHDVFSQFGVQLEVEPVFV